MSASFKQQITQAIEYHKLGKIQAAEKIYKTLLDQEPNNIEVLHLAAILYGQNSNLDQARRLIDKAIKQQTNQASIYVTSGNIARQEGKFDLAIKHFNHAIVLKPQNATAYHNLGILMTYKQDYIAAIDYYQKAIEIRPHYSDAYLHQSIALIKTDQFESAKEALVKGCEVDPNHPDLWLNLGQLYQREKKIDEAISAYLKTLNLNPKSAAIHYLLGTAYAQKDQLDEAFDQFVITLKLEPKHVDSMHNLASLFFREGKYPKALNYWLKMLSIEPDQDTHYNIGVTYFYQGKLEDAKPYLKEALKQRPDFIPALINLAGIYIKQDQTKKAVKLYQQVLDIEPNNTQVQYVLAALEGRNIDQHHKAPDDYVTHLFDQYAPNFERHLKETLAYRAPELICQALERHLDKPSNLSVLDLGCGTGLCGVVLKPLAKRLVGVDLSSHMLTIAKHKDVYDDLVTMEITKYLKQDQSFNLIVAGDVLPYFGDLTMILTLAKQRLYAGGFFIFTVEKLQGEQPYKLDKSARFKHNIDHLNQLIEQLGWQLIENEAVVTRTQNNESVYSELLLLQKP